jgi:hypothetical protein
MEDKSQLNIINLKLELRGIQLKDIMFAIPAKQ